MSSSVFEDRQVLSPLGTLTVLALVGCALSCAALMLQAATIIPPLLILGMVALAVAGFVVSGIPWAPMLGSLYGIGTMIGGLVSQQYLPYHLTHPAQVGFFLAALLLYVFDIVAIYSGICATLQNYRSTSRRAPGWFAMPLIGLSGFVLGAFLTATVVAMMAQAPSEGVSAGGPATVHMGVSNFEQSTVTLAKGSRLTLVDDGQFLHILGNGTWENTTARPASEPGAPALHNLQVNGKSVQIGPFNTAGTFHIYCTIHAGMNLTVFVR